MPRVFIGTVGNES